MPKPGEFMAEDSKTLIDQARAGDRLALEQLLMTHADELRCHLVGRFPSALKGVIAVEDVVQESLTKAYLNIDQLRESSAPAFRAWLKTMGEMVMLDFLRAEKAQKRGGKFRRRQATTDSVTGSLVDLMGKLPGDSITASRVISEQEGVSALQAAIAGLVDDQRKAIQLHVLQGLPIEETAQAMDRSPAAVRSLIQRGKQKLAEAMGRASMWLSPR